MKTKQVLLVLLTFVLAAILFSCKTKPTETPALETKITGKVFDKATTNVISGAIVTTNPTTSSVSSDANGSYTIADVKAGQYVVTATKDGYKPATVNVVVTEGKTSPADIQMETVKPELTVSVSSIDFGTSQTTATFVLSNGTSVGTINFSVAKSVDWLTVSPISGTISNGNATITVTASRTNLSFGNYTTNITVNSGAGNKDIPVTMTVQNPNAPQLTVVPASMDFDSTKTQQTISISNSGTGTLNWSISSNQSWAAINPSNGTNTGTVTVTVSRAGLNPGSYAAQLSVTSNGGNVNILVQIKVPIPPTIPAINVTPLNLDFDSTKTQQTISISNSGTGTLNWSISSNQSWVTINPSNGTNTSTVTVTVSRTGLNPGSSAAQLSVTSNGGNVNISVVMKVPNVLITAPVANFVADITSGTTPLDVHFSDQSVGTINSWSWDFGDGNSSDEKNPTHTYNIAGSFTVSLTVNGPGGTNIRTRNNYISVTQVLFYEPFDNLNNWVLSKPYSLPNGWSISQNGYKGTCAYLGSIESIDQYIEREVTLLSDGTLNIWVKHHVNDGSRYVYIDGQIKYDGATAQWDTWEKITFSISKGVHTIRLRGKNPYSAGEYFDELSITSP